MAIQNFLSGGYYGKLGATVGQRWKNKRTIRTYVKPANPRTEVQQANRNKFANAVTFAQMGMQMNYYATVFDDPNFTHWNYRMKVARELRNQGLSNLDLIPLYPTSFVPPTLIQSVEVSGIQGQKHITFAVENLNGNSDRVLSLMFALYDENDVFLGYKLYLGYYYASKPGLLEVDVDSVSEINSHCFVRMVTNDDTNSLTDMIASPNLQIKQSGPETRAFDTTIREVQKSPAGIKVIFEEPWKDAPTVNTITITANFISNGANANATATSAALVNENGYCSILVPFVTSDNQHLPAFPSGSNFAIAAVDYEGATWVYTKTDDNIAYSDTDLTRSFISNVSSISRSGTTFSVVLSETLPTFTSRNLTLAIHAVKNGAWVDENVAITSITDDTITFEQSGVSGADIYAFPSGATITLTGTVTSNGITYSAETQTAQSVSNADLARNFISNVSSISRSGTTFSVVLSETLPTFTSQNITLEIHAVKNGAWVDENVTITNISNNTITFEQSGASGANIYAFPSGATITLTGTVTGNGVTYSAETQTAQSVSNADLSRSILSTPTWNSASTSDIAFTIPFGGTVSTELKSLQMVCSGRLGKRDAIAQNFSCSGDGSNITFTCTGGYRNYPMCESGDKISLTEMQFVCNGVTYNLSSQDVNLRNNIDTSYYFENLDWQFMRDGAAAKYDQLYTIAMYTVINGLSRADFSEVLDDLFAVKIVSANINVYPTNSDANGYSVESGFQIDLTSYFDGVEYSASISPTDTVIKTIPGITIDGIMYTFSEGWFNLNVPSTVQGFPI